MLELATLLLLMVSSNQFWKYESEWNHEKYGNIGCGVSSLGTFMFSEVLLYKLYTVKIELGLLQRATKYADFSSHPMISF